MTTDQATGFPARTETTSLQDRPNAYGPVSRLNHWLTAAGFLAALTLGLVIGYGGLARETVGALMDWHKLFGVIVLGYGLWRVGWRIAQGFPAPAAPMPRWQAAISKTVHVGLLAAILAMPLSGVLMTLAGGRALDLWGVTLLPSLGEIGWLDVVAGTLHDVLPPLILVLLVLHIGATLMHHFVDRDATLVRMTSGRQGNA